MHDITHSLVLQKVVAVQASEGNGQQQIAKFLSLVQTEKKCTSRKGLLR